MAVVSQEEFRLGDGKWLSRKRGLWLGVAGGAERLRAPLAPRSTSDLACSRSAVLKQPNARPPTVLIRLWRAALARRGPHHVWRRCQWPGPGGAARGAARWRCLSRAAAAVADAGLLYEPNLWNLLGRNGAHRELRVADAAGVEGGAVGGSELG